VEVFCALPRIKREDNRLLRLVVFSSFLVELRQNDVGMSCVFVLLRCLLEFVKRVLWIIGLHLLEQCASQLLVRLRAVWIRFYPFFRAFHSSIPLLTGASSGAGYGNGRQVCCQMAIEIALPFGGLAVVFDERLDRGQ